MRNGRLIVDERMGNFLVQPARQRMAESEWDANRTIVVLDIPGEVGEDDLEIHFQRGKNGGGDVNKVEILDGQLAFISFDLAEVVQSVLACEHVISGKTVQTLSFQAYQRRKQDATDAKDKLDAEVDKGMTVFVSGTDESLSDDTIQLFFENKRMSGGGDLQRFERLSPKVARLDFLSTKDAENVLQKSPLTWRNYVLKVSMVEPLTHDKNIILVRNLNPKTVQETLKDFVEFKTRVKVRKVVFGKDNKAIVILEKEAERNFAQDMSTEDRMLHQSIVSLEFAPITHSIRIANIPPGAEEDQVKFKFFNPQTGGGTGTVQDFDQKKGLAVIKFNDHLVASRLVKSKHFLGETELKVIPCYEDFEELEEVKTKTYQHSGSCSIHPNVLDFVTKRHDIEAKFALKLMKYDAVTSTLHFTKDFEGEKDDSAKFEADLKSFLENFTHDKLKVPEDISKRLKLKETFEAGDEFREGPVVVTFDDALKRVTFCGEKEHVTQRKASIENTISRLVEESKPVSDQTKPVDVEKLQFLDFIGYWQKLSTEFPEVSVNKIVDSPDRLSLFGAQESVKDAKIRIFEDLHTIKTINMKMSQRQMEFLKQAGIGIVNDFFKRDDASAMLKLKFTDDVDDSAKKSGAELLMLKHSDRNEEKRLINIVYEKIAEKCLPTDKETLSFLEGSSKLAEFRNDELKKHEVMITSESSSQFKIWIVCEKSRMNDAEQRVLKFIERYKITRCSFTPMDPNKMRFLKQHRMKEIDVKAKSLAEEGVVVESPADVFEIKGTGVGVRETKGYLVELAGKIKFKSFHACEPGMGKQFEMEATKGIIESIEKSRECIIEQDVTKPSLRDATLSPGDTGKTPAETPLFKKLPYDRLVSVNEKEFKMVTGQRISVVFGDLAKQKVDVIVNTTSDKIDLNANPCGKALLKVAGKELEDECQKIGSLTVGKMVSTGAGKLACKRVYHVRCANWDQGKGKPVLLGLVKTCLQQAANDGYTSIAFPAVGTGKLGFPHAKVAKLFFKEVTKFLTNKPRTQLADIRLVAYDRDHPCMDAFSKALKEIQSGILSTSAKKGKDSKLSNGTTTEKPDGSLELSLGKSLRVQIVCDDITKESNTDLIMHVTNAEFSFQGGVGKAILKAKGGESILNECKAFAKPSLFSVHFTKPGGLSVGQIAHVVGPDRPNDSELRKCLEAFFDEILKRNIAKVSFSAIGAGAMGFSEKESADLILTLLSEIAQKLNLSLKLVRIVIFEKSKFENFKRSVKEFSSGDDAARSSPKDTQSFLGRAWSRFASPRISTDSSNNSKSKISVKVYAESSGVIEKAWADFEKKIKESIGEELIEDDAIKKFPDCDMEKLSKLEGNYDVEISVDKNKGHIVTKGHLADILPVQKEIQKILVEIKERGVPEYWENSDKEVLRVVLQTTSPEYNEVKAAFEKTAPGNLKIEKIERIQNKYIYGMYLAKRKAMEEKYGKLDGKELMLFHGTSNDVIEQINSGGLNRTYAGKNATYFGRGVYFARDASYSCQKKFSPEDGQNLRYMYYAKVLVGEYTLGSTNMMVPPPKDPSNPNIKFDSAVDNVQNPGIFVLFHDYEFYTEYLITFK